MENIGFFFNNAKNSRRNRNKLTYNDKQHDHCVN